MKRQTLCFLLGLLLIIPLPIHAYDFQSGDLYYNITSNEAPYTVEVTYQEYRSFFNYINLTTLTIPEMVANDGKTYSVTSIGDYAFYGCARQTFVSIPKSVTKIGEGAFAWCLAFTTSVIIPDNVTSIGENAFNKVNNVIYSGTAQGAPWGAKSLNGYVEEYLVYESTAKLQLLGCFPTPNRVLIPNSVTTIGDYAFYSCSKDLMSVTIGNSVESIGDHAFFGCDGLTSITIPNGVTNIGKQAFARSGLTSVTLSNSITSIEDSTFCMCEGLTSLIIGNSVTNIGNYAFCNCSGLTSVTIGNSVESIGDYAFSGCSSLTSIMIPNSVTNIGKRAFAFCEDLTSVTINSVPSLADLIFYNCYSLTSIVLYAMVPPVWNKRTLGIVPEDGIAIYVPCAVLDDYKQSEEWKDFDIHCIASEVVDMSGNIVIVTPSEHDATFTWPSNSNANAYTLVITKDDVVFCTLTFNANGQLMGIAFAPSKDRNNAHAPQAAQATVNGWQFTVTGLNEGSNYAYAMTVTDNSGTELQTYNGTFRTLGTTALDNINAADAAPVQKILRNGQVFILRGNEVYTVTGQKVAE